jgi:hypothetical protein
MHDENLREGSEISKHLSLVLEHPSCQDNRMQFNVLISKNVRKRRTKLEVKNIFITVISKREI